MRKALNHIERSNRVNVRGYAIEAGRAADPIVAGGQDALIDGHTARADRRLRGEPDRDRVRRSRGADLAYLTALPPDQASARRAVHDAVARLVGASGSGRRQAPRLVTQRRGLPKVKSMRTAPPPS